MFIISGYVRDYSESYRICLHSMNILILILFINWGVEFIFITIRKRNKLNDRSASYTIE